MHLHPGHPLRALQEYHFFLLQTQKGFPEQTMGFAAKEQKETASDTIRDVAGKAADAVSGTVCCRFC